MIHVTFADELVKAIHHWGMDAGPFEVTYGNRQTVIIVTTPSGERVVITVEKAK